MPEQYSLKWNNFHANLTTGFHGLFEDEDLVDVSLAVEGKIIQAHKVILSVCSPYFKSLFRIHPEKHPIVFLKDVGYSEVIGLLQFMYQGQVDVSQEQLTEFLRVAEMLQIKGLACNSDTEPANTSSSDSEPLIPLPILSTPKSAPKLNNSSTPPSNANPNSNVNHTNALKRKKPLTPVVHVPSDNNNAPAVLAAEPSFKIVNVESLKKQKLNEDACVTNGTSNEKSAKDSLASSDSTNPKQNSETTTKKSSTNIQMIPKLEPVEDYNDSSLSFTDYSELGENFMTHFIMEEQQQTEPGSRSSQSSVNNFSFENQKPTGPPSSATVAASSNSEQSPPNKLTTQQIMNIDVSLLQEWCFKKPRTYTWHPDTMKAAILAVQSGRKLREVSRSFNLPYSSIRNQLFKLSQVSATNNQADSETFELK